MAEQSLGDKHTEPHPPVVWPRGDIGLPECPQHITAEAGAVVCNGDDNPLRIPVDPDLDTAAGKVEGILRQIAEAMHDLGQPRRGGLLALSKNVDGELDPAAVVGAERRFHHCRDGQFRKRVFGVRAAGQVGQDLAAALGLGQQAFAANCVACHEAQGQGKIGPNLTDAAWLHGGSPLEIFRTIRDGVPAKGMPSWGPALGRTGVAQVTAFVLSLRNKNIPGKAPEGEVSEGPEPEATTTNNAEPQL